MKKLVMMLAATAALTACGGGQKPATAENAEAMEVAEVVGMNYVGALPAADAPGIGYNLTINDDSTYTLITVEQGNPEAKEDTVTGKWTIVSKEVDGATLTAYKTDADPAEYFLQLNDSTLRLVNDELTQPFAQPEMYNLNLQK